MLNTELVTLFDDDAFYYFDEFEILSDDPNNQATILNSYVSSGVMTKNEARSKLNLPPLDETNVNEIETNNEEVK